LRIAEPDTPEGASGVSCRVVTGDTNGARNQFLGDDKPGRRRHFKQSLAPGFATERINRCWREPRQVI